MDVAAWKVAVSQFMRCEGQRSSACLKLSIRARLMQKPSLQSESLPEELKRFGDVWHVEDGVAEFHCWVADGRVGVDGIRLLKGGVPIPWIAWPRQDGFVNSGGPSPATT